MGYGSMCVGGGVGWGEEWDKGDRENGQTTDVQSNEIPFSGLATFHDCMYDI